MLHIFDNACNLIGPNGNVIAVVTSAIGDGPFNIVVPSIRFQDHVSIDETPSYNRGILRIGELEIDTTKARIWNPCPPWPRLKSKIEHRKSHAHLLRRLLEETAPEDSLASLVVTLPMPSSHVEMEMIQTARAPFGKLLTGLRSGDVTRCREGTSGLVGLGNGLTPAGDDLLLGCLLAIWLRFDRDLAEKFAGAITEVVRERTTPLSTAWLQAAAQGKCSQPWHTFFESLVHGSEAEVHANVRGILRHGHTSGASSLAGFLALFSDG